MFPDYRNPLPCVATSADGYRRKGEPDAFKADDGRVLNVDMSQVSQSVKQAMQPNLGAKLAGFPGDQPNKFTARLIEQDNPGRASTAPAATTVSDKIAPFIPQFIGAKEFQDLQAALPSSPAAAQLFVTQLYQGILKRAPTAKDRALIGRASHVGAAARAEVTRPTGSPSIPAELRA